MSGPVVDYRWEVTKVGKQFLWSLSKNRKRCSRERLSYIR